MDGHVHGYFSLFSFTGKFCVLFYNNNNINNNNNNYYYYYYYYFYSFLYSAFICHIKSKTHLNWHFCQVTPFIKCSFMAEWVPERGSTLRLLRRLIENCTIIHCLVLFLFSKVILVSHGSILFLHNSVIVRTIDGGEKWTNHQLPFQVTGPLLFHPREEDWILGRGVVNGKVHGIFCLLYTTGNGHCSITHMFLARQSTTLHANYMRKYRRETRM